MSVSFSSLFAFFSDGSINNKPWHQKVLETLSISNVTPKQIIDALAENLTLKEYYDKLAGVIEGYTVRQHTEMVLGLAQRYRKQFESEISEHLDWSHFLLFLALHDIGKGASKEASDNTSAKEAELGWNRKVLAWTCEQLRIRSNIGHIFQALLMYDSQGDYLKGDIEAESYKRNLLEMAAVSRLSPIAFYQIYSSFHMIDAASYPNLRQLFIFKEDSLLHCEGNQSLIDYLKEIL